MGNPNAVSGRPFPPQHRNNAPYSLLQQQQQGMMGTHTGLANQVAMASPGQPGHPSLVLQRKGLVLSVDSNNLKIGLFLFPIRHAQ